jgi:hypothetical protein
MGRPAVRRRGDIEVRFRDAGELPTGRRAIAGSIRGQAPDMGIPGSVAPRDVSVTVAGTGTTGACCDGQTAFSVAVDTLTGRAVGTFRFNELGRRRRHLPRRVGANERPQLTARPISLRRSFRGGADLVNGIVSEPIDPAADVANDDPQVGGSGLAKEAPLANHPSLATFA